MTEGEKFTIEVTPTWGSVAHIDLMVIEQHLKKSMKPEVWSNIKSDIKKMAQLSDCLVDKCTREE